MTGLEVRKGRNVHCVYCNSTISAEEKRVVIHNGPEQWNFPRSAHMSCFVQHNRIPIVELAYALHLIDAERYDYISSMYLAATDGSNGHS